MDETRRLLGTSIDTGLTHEEVKRRNETYGWNELVEGARTSLLSIVVRQFKSLLVLVLLGAGVVTLGLGHVTDAVVICIAVLINVVVGAFQEERASKAFDKLRTSQARHAIVMRDGTRKNVDAKELVPGDVVLLEPGFYVPADIRLVTVHDLRVNESVLTGEWLSVSKATELLRKNVPLAERTNMAYLGTLVEAGSARGIVVATGMQTEVGNIARDLSMVADTETPLQTKLRKVVEFLSYVIVVVLVALFLLGIVRGEPFGDMLLLSIAIAVATIPSGLPAAVTVVLARGMEAILKKGGLVRNLLAAETLGATTVILTDKTGTLTEARMKLASLHTYDAILAGRSDLYEATRIILESAIMVSDAFIEEADEVVGKLIVHGRPIEKAVLVAGIEAGIIQRELLATSPRLDTLKFSSERRFAASLHKGAKRGQFRLIMTGEPETLLALSTHYLADEKRVKWTDEALKRFVDTFEGHMKEGRRLIAVSCRDVPFETLPTDTEVTHLPNDATFLGLIGFTDPVRKDVPAAIAEVERAGARVMMCTGDSPATALSIATEAGIARAGDSLVIHGNDIDHWTDTELYGHLTVARVIARATPQHKLRIVNLLRKNGEVVAMTGDGVNDSPALRAASIGVAVGSGTEVAKEASDLILVQDSFSIIVSAIEEGRAIIDNLKKIVAYFLSTSFSEIIVISAALIGGAPLPLLPVQILWGKIVEEGLMSFSFAFEGKDPNIMRRNPRHSSAGDILTNELRKLIIVVSVTTGGLMVALFFWLTTLSIPIEEIRTVMFVALSLDAIFFTFSLKSLDTPLWRINLFSNRFLIVAFTLSCTLVILALTVPFLQTVLKLVPLTGFEVLALVAVGFLNLVVIETMKYILFVRPSTQARASMTVEQRRGTL